MITDNQILHRQYLKSELWQKIRRQALDKYGPICSRCGGDGFDVHHKTYDRVGGTEQMEDLEIMCRSCHEAHHAVERATRNRAPKIKNKGILQSAVFRYLTNKQKETLRVKFTPTTSFYHEILAALAYGNLNSAIMKEALRMLGKDYAYGMCRNKANILAEIKRKKENKAFTQKQQSFNNIKNQKTDYWLKKQTALIQLKQALT